MTDTTAGVKLLAVALNVVRPVVFCADANLLARWNRLLTCPAPEAAAMPRLPTKHNSRRCEVVATARAPAGVLPLALPWQLPGTASCSWGCLPACTAHACRVLLLLKRFCESLVARQYGLEVCRAMVAIQVGPSAWWATSMLLMLSWVRQLSVAWCRLMMPGGSLWLPLLRRVVPLWG